NGAYGFLRSTGAARGLRADRRGDRPGDIVSGVGPELAGTADPARGSVRPRRPHRRGGAAGGAGRSVPHWRSGGDRETGGDAGAGEWWVGCGGWRRWFSRGWERGG